MPRQAHHDRRAGGDDARQRGAASRDDGTVREVQHEDVQDLGQEVARFSFLVPYPEQVNPLSERRVFIFYVFVHEGELLAKAEWIQMRNPAPILRAAQRKTILLPTHEESYRGARARIAHPSTGEALRL